MRRCSLPQPDRGKKGLLKSLLVHLSSRVQIIEIQNRVEDERVTGDSGCASEAEPLESSQGDRNWRECKLSSYRNRAGIRSILLKTPGQDRGVFDSQASTLAQIRSGRVDRIADQSHRACAPFSNWPAIAYSISD